MDVINGWAIFGRAILVGFIVSFAVITGFAYTTLLERKLLARLQGRIGPNRVGYIAIPRRGKKELRLLGGVMQPAADAVKLFFKEDPTPEMVDRVVFNIAPMLSVIPAVLILAVIPWAGKIELLGAAADPYLAVAPGINVALMYILAITSIGVYGIILAGWASNSKYAIMGGIRASAQMISYELAMGLSVLPVVILADSLNLGQIVAAQQNAVGSPHTWFIFRQPIAAIVMYIAIMAELQRAPFDLLEAEQELSSGYNVEYAGMRFGMFFLAEYMQMISFSAIWASLFLGGYDGPLVQQLPGLGILYMVIKIIISLSFMIWVRASLPRFRYDQLMGFGWKTLLPISVINLIVTVVIVVMANL